MAFYFFASMNVWNPTLCSGEWREEPLIVSFLIILKKNCTDNSSSKVHLFTKFKLQAKWNTLASASTKKKGRGDFSDKAGSSGVVFPF